MGVKKHRSLLRIIILKFFHLQPKDRSRKRFYHHTWNNTTWTKYMKQQFARHWISNNKGQQSFEDKTNKVSERTVPSVREFSGHGTGRRNVSEAQQTPWVGDMDTGSSEKAEQLEFIRQHAKGRRQHGDRTWTSVKNPLKYSSEDLSAHSCKETTQRQGENHH